MNNNVGHSKIDYIDDCPPSKKRRIDTVSRVLSGQTSATNYGTPLDENHIIVHDRTHSLNHSNQSHNILYISRTEYATHENCTSQWTADVVLRGVQDEDTIKTSCQSAVTLELATLSADSHDYLLPYGDLTFQQNVEATADKSMDTWAQEPSPQGIDMTMAEDLTTLPSFQDDMVCYGMLSDIEVTNIGIGCESNENLPAQWDGHMHLLDAWDGHNIVLLPDKIHQLLLTLAANVNASFQFWIRLTQQMEGGVQNTKSALAGQHSNDVTLSIIVYGPFDKARVVGDWLSSAGMFLQMPVECFIDVKYRNPHCLSFDIDPPSTTSELKSAIAAPGVEDEVVKVGDFDGLYTDETYDEAPQPSKIATLLHKHQRTALYFMLLQEKGWDFDSTRITLWKRHTDQFGTSKYKNTLSGRVQTRLPDDFKGGILADEMGLGKTCTMLSLIAMDFPSGDAPFCSTTVPEIYPGTLIIVPFSLLHVWEKQIRTHFRPHSITWLVYHSIGRQSDLCNLSKYNIVITTYNTVAIEYRNRKSSRDCENRSRLFAAQWHRLILDEAHVIRNKATVISKAVCSLRSERRWCITGTPLQNRLSDLYGIIRFLDVEPYNKFKNFENDVLRPWRARNDKVALMRLLHLMKSIAIRRPRNVIQLTPKQDLAELVTLTDTERAAYNKARDGALNMLDNIASGFFNKPAAYINALQRINDMRFICNHGFRPQTKKARDANQLEGSYDLYSITTGLDNLIEMNSVTCSECGTDLQEEREIEGRLYPSTPSYFNSSGPQQLCLTCSQRLHRPEMLPTPSPSSSDREDPSSPSPQVAYRSSKIQALIGQLLRIPCNDKSVVFSCWTFTLAAVAKALAEAGIIHVQYDGSLSRRQRSQALQEFETNPNVRVILVSITCGGQGLDLTVANNAFLLEPQWNPMLEEQAMSRVHRLGQKKPVKLVRFIVQGTWEEKIRALQERKRDLFNLIIDRKTLKEGDEGRKQLHFLRELIA